MTIWRRTNVVQQAMFFSILKCAQNCDNCIATETPRFILRGLRVLCRKRQLTSGYEKLSCLVFTLLSVLMVFLCLRIAKLWDFLVLCRKWQRRGSTRILFNHKFRCFKKRTRNPKMKWRKSCKLLKNLPWIMIRNYKKLIRRTRKTINFLKTSHLNRYYFNFLLLVSVSVFARHSYW